MVTLSIDDSFFLDVNARKGPTTMIIENDKQGKQITRRNFDGDSNKLCDEMGINVVLSTLEQELLIDALIIPFQFSSR